MSLKLSQFTASPAAPASTDSVPASTFGATPNSTQNYAFSLLQVASTAFNSIGMTIGSAVLVGGVSGKLLYDNAGVLGEATVGSGLALSGGTIAATIAAANPTATAGTVAVNGSAATFMRSDAAPKVQLGSASQAGLVQVDGTTISASSVGVISATIAAANPTATAGPNAVNGAASTFMRSDAAPAIQKAGSAQFGLVEVDNVTIKVTASNNGIIATVPAAFSQFSIASPVGPTSITTFKMQGLAGSITPARTGVVYIGVSGYCTANATTAGNGLIGQISYGTGTAPGNNAGLVGTQIGTRNQARIGTTLTAAADWESPISWNAVVSGLSIGTTYWIDVAAESIGVASVCALNQVMISCVELT